MNNEPLEEEMLLHEEEVVIPEEEEQAVSNGPTKVIVRDLTFHCTENDLSALFEGYPVVWISIKRNEENNHSLLHGFIHLSSQEAAEKLVQTFHGRRFMGRKLKLQLCGTPPVDGMFEQRGIQVFVRYESIFHGNQDRVTEETLYELCQQFGTIEDVLIRRHHENCFENSTIKYQKGYGFVYFTNRDSIYSAERGTPIEANNIRFKCELAHKTNDLLNGDGNGHQPNGHNERPSQHVASHLHHLNNSSMGNMPRGRSSNYTPRGDRARSNHSPRSYNNQRQADPQMIMIPQMPLMNNQNGFPQQMFIHANPAAGYNNGANAVAGNGAANFYPGMQPNNAANMMPFPPQAFPGIPYPGAMMPHLVPNSASPLSNEGKVGNDWNQAMMFQPPPFLMSNPAMFHANFSLPHPYATMPANLAANPSGHPYPFQLPAPVSVQQQQHQQQQTSRQANSHSQQANTQQSHPHSEGFQSSVAVNNSNNISNNQHQSLYSPQFQQLQQQQPHQQMHRHMNSNHYSNHNNNHSNQYHNNSNLHTTNNSNGSHTNTSNSPTNSNSHHSMNNNSHNHTNNSNNNGNSHNHHYQQRNSRNHGNNNPNSYNNNSNYHAPKHDYPRQF